MILSNKQNPFIYCVAAVILFWAFGGCNPSYEAIKSQLNIFGEVISILSPFHYSYQLESIIELQTYPSMFDMESALSSIQYSFKNKNQCILALILYWICGNVLAMLYIQYLYYSNHFPVTLFRIPKNTLTNFILNIFHYNSKSGNKKENKNRNSDDDLTVYENNNNNNNNNGNKDDVVIGNDNKIPKKIKSTGEVFDEEINL